MWFGYQSPLFCAALSSRNYLLLYIYNIARSVQCLLQNPAIDIAWSLEFACILEHCLVFAASDCSGCKAKFLLCLSALSLSVCAAIASHVLWGHLCRCAPELGCVRP